jgi:hypothetical protein
MPLSVAAHELPYSLAQPTHPFLVVPWAHWEPVPYAKRDPAHDCGIGNHIVLNLSIGGVCFGATPDQGWDNGNAGFTDALGNPAGSTDTSHLTPAGPGYTTTIDVTDSTFALIPATYCQALVGDICGGDLTAGPEPGNPNLLCQNWHVQGIAGCTVRSAPFVTFCDSITVFGGVSPDFAGVRRPAGMAPGQAGDGTWADPTLFNWDVDSEVYIFPFGFAAGNIPELNPCGPTHIGWGTQGTISHS